MRLLRRSPPALYVRRRRYEAELRPSAAEASSPELAAQVIARGAAILPRHLDRARLAAVNAEVLPVLGSSRDNASVEIDADGPGFPAVGEFARDPFLSETMTAIAGTSVRLFAVTANLRHPGIGEPAIDFWHTDTWRVRLKAMLFLEEVSPGAGPMHYGLGSHTRSRRHPGRSAYDAARELDQRLGRRLARRAARSGAGELVGTGPAGSLLVFDPRGFHTATEPVDRARRTITLTFVRTSDLPGGRVP